MSKLVHWPVPRDVTEVRSYLGLGSYYRRYVNNYSELARPLIELTKKDKKFEWDQKCQQSFASQKRILTSPEIMAYPRDEGLFILDTDACGTSIGAVLSQVQDNRERIIAYGSKT